MHSVKECYLNSILLYYKFNKMDIIKKNFKEILKIVFLKIAKLWFH